MWISIAFNLYLTPIIIIDPNYPASYPQLSVVTRPQNQATSLCQLIHQYHGHAITLPLIAIKPLMFALDQQQSLLKKADIIIFISANAVIHARPLYNAIIQNSALKIAAIGNKTLQTLKSENITPDIAPSDQFNSEALLNTTEMHHVQNKHIVIIRGKGGRELLAQTLMQRGSYVHYIEVYERIMPEYTDRQLINILSTNIDVLTATSNEMLDNLSHVIQRINSIDYFNKPLVVISERMVKYARKLGFKSLLLTDHVSDEAIVETILTHFTVI